MRFAGFLREITTPASRLHFFTGIVTTSEEVAISMAAVGHAEEDGYAERVIGTIKEEEVALNEYSDLASAKLRIRHFIDDVCCTKRIHSSLGYLTPAEFAAGVV